MWCPEEEKKEKREEKSMPALFMEINRQYGMRSVSYTHLDVYKRQEVFHGVKITDSALVAAATLSHRYITDRFLPDKAIDLVDEACALIKTELDSMPSELDEQRRKIMQLEIEESALKKETDNLSKERLEALQKLSLIHI